jgi:hypothetical protein
MEPPERSARSARSGSDSQIGFDLLERVAGEGQIGLGPVERQVEEQAVLLRRALEEPDQVILLGEGDKDVRIFARTTSVFPAAATSRSRYLPPPREPSDIPLSQSTKATPRAPSIAMASLRAVSMFTSSAVPRIASVSRYRDTVPGTCKTLEKCITLSSVTDTSCNCLTTGAPKVSSFQLLTVTLINVAGPPGNRLFSRPKNSTLEAAGSGGT